MPRLLRVAAVLTWFLLPSFANGDALHLSGGVDVRAVLQRKADLKLEGAFFNLRKVFSDESGDRVILVFQVDIEEEFNRSHLYYTYVQLKGPLGQWNLRAGRYIVPFGLLAYYDTERLLLRTMEPQSLGIKLDEGIQVYGFWKTLDYAVSLTNGVEDHLQLVTSRVGRFFGDAKVGFSILLGKLPERATSETVEANEPFPGAALIHKRRVGVDVEKFLGPWLARGELIGGREGGRNVWGSYLEIALAMSPKLELGANAVHWQSRREENRFGLGFSYQLLPGAYLRGAYVHEEGEVNDDRLSLQIYAEFSRLF